MVSAISLEGYQKLDPNYKRRFINIYLNEDITFSEFSDIVEQRFGILNVYRQVEDGRYAGAKERAEERISAYLERYNIDSVAYAVMYNGDIIMSGSSAAYQIERITDYQEFLEVQISSYSGIVKSVVQLVAAVSFVITALILSMTVRSIVAKRRRELGTMKACGYTSKQLARQMAISFMPMTAIGVVLGCTLGAVTFSPMMSASLAVVGVQNARFDVNPLLVVSLGALVIIVTYIVANVSAMGIKKISAYELLTE